MARACGKWEEQEESDGETDVRGVALAEGRGRGGAREVMREIEFAGCV